jgi:hypothetical protein
MPICKLGSCFLPVRDDYLQNQLVASALVPSAKQVRPKIANYPTRDYPKNRIFGILPNPRIVLSPEKEVGCAY